MEKKEKKYELVPYEIKKKAIAELEGGFIGTSAFMEKYGITSHTTISNWKRQIKRGYRRTNIRYSEAQKIRFVNEVLSGLRSAQDIKNELDLDSVRTVANWISKYGDLAVEQKLQEEVKKDLASSEHEQELYQARLKILALETLISTAEKELKISIRKKYGTKQLEK